MLKKILIFLLVILIAVLVVIYYYWNKVTTLPSWYKPQAAGNHPVIDTRKTAERSRAIISNKLPVPLIKTGKQKTAQPVELRLSEDEVNDLLLAALLEKSAEHDLSKVIKATHTEIKNGTMESGAVVNLSDLSKDQLGDNEQKTFEKAMTIFPFLKDQEVYIGVEGRPVLENNALTISGDSRVKIGETEHDLNTLAEMLDINPKKLRDAVRLSLDSVELNQVRVESNQILLKGQSR